MKLAFVDSLRGLAALMVVICHVAYIPSPNLQAPNTFLRLVNAGKAGVILFFIISAFTLCLSFQLRNSSFSPIHACHFYLRRLFRVMPLFLFSIPIAWARDLIVYDYPRPLNDTLVSAMSAFVPNSHDSVVWASWTLGVEFLFYILFPLVFRICNTLRRTLFFLLTSVVVDISFSAFLLGLATSNSPPSAGMLRAELLSQLDSDIRFSFIHNLQFFILGIVMFYCYRDFVSNGRIKSKYGRLFIALGISSFLAFVLFFPLSLESVLYGRNLFVGISFLSLALGSSLCQSKVIVNRCFISLGVISYSLYSLHPPLIAALLKSFEAVYAIDCPDYVSYLLCLSLTMFVLVPASFLTFHLIEKPGVHLGKSLIRRV